MEENGSQPICPRNRVTTGKEKDQRGQGNPKIELREVKKDDCLGVEFLLEHNHHDEAGNGSVEHGKRGQRDQ